MEKRGSTIADLMERRRILDGAKEYKGHTYLDLARFDENTKHMIIFDVLTHNSPVGDKGRQSQRKPKPTAATNCGIFPAIPWDNWNTRLWTL